MNEHWSQRERKARSRIAWREAHVEGLESGNVGGRIVYAAIVWLGIRTTVRQSKECRTSGISETRTDTPKTVSGNSVFKQSCCGTRKIFIGAADRTVGNEMDLTEKGRRDRKQNTTQQYGFLLEHSDLLDDELNPQKSRGDCYRWDINS